MFHIVCNLHNIFYSPSLDTHLEILRLTRFLTPFALSIVETKRILDHRLCIPPPESL